MVDASTWTKPKLMHTTATQTDVTEPTRPTLATVRRDAHYLGQFVTDRKSLIIAVKKTMRAHLKMPSLTTATLQVTMPFSTIPLGAWKSIFPMGVMQWHADRQKSKHTFVGLLTDPFKLMINPSIDLSELIEFGLGVCKAAVPSSGGEARSRSSPTCPRSRSGIRRRRTARWRAC